MLTTPEIPRENLDDPIWTIRLHLWHLPLAAVLGLALYYRVAGLDEVQNFQGDSGYFYMIAWRWFFKGEWPLLGPWRSVTRDFTIGPGWYYMTLPPIALSGFSVKAGGAVTAFYECLAGFLYWLWTYRATGNRWAGFIPLLVFAFSPSWVEMDRTLSNPTFIPLATICFACVILEFPRAPLACLASGIALISMVPHWHTTGVPVTALATFFIAWLTFRYRAELRAEPLKKWVKYCSALSIFLAFLFIPPFIHELRPGPGNLIPYIKGTLNQTEAAKEPLAERISLATRLLLETLDRYSFATASSGWTRTFSAWLWGLALPTAFMVWCFKFIWIGIRRSALLSRRRVGIPDLPEETGSRPAELSVPFLFLALVGYWWAAVGKGSGFTDYFFCGIFPVPALLTGWLAGTALASTPGSLALRVAFRAIGGCMIALFVGLAMTTAPHAARVHVGGTWHQKTFAKTQVIADHIAKSAQGKSFSLTLMEPNNYRLHFVFLLTQAGCQIKNGDNSNGDNIPSDQLGRSLFIIARRSARELPLVGDFLDEASKTPEIIGDAQIFRIPARLFPRKFERAEVTMDDKAIYVKTFP